MVSENMVSKKYLDYFVGAFVAIFLLTSGGVSIAQATETVTVEPTVEKSPILSDCSQLYSFVNSSPFTIPQGSWFWQEARNYLASVGMPHDNYHVKMFEEAFEAVYSKTGDEGFDHKASYNMAPVFQKSGFGDIAYDYCSES